MTLPLSDPENDHDSLESLVVPANRYWDLHKALEAQGKIHHTREQCPDRDGPREILAWEPATGWRTVASKK